MPTTQNNTHQRLTARLPSKISAIYYAYLAHLEYIKLPPPSAQIVPEPKEKVVAAVIEKAKANQTKKLPGIIYHTIKRLNSKKT